MQDAADQVMDLIFGRWRSQTLSAGTELGVFDHLNKDRAKKAETLATELNVDPALRDSSMPCRAIRRSSPPWLWKRYVAMISPGLELSAMWPAAMDI